MELNKRRQMMSPETSAVQAALLQDNDALLYRIMEDLTRRAWVGEVRAADAEEVMQQLQEHSQFGLMLRLGDALLADDESSRKVRCRYCQALIGLGALDAAERELQRLLSQAPVPSEVGEASGLLGRISKERFVARRKPSDLNQAIRHYRAGWDTNTDPQWHGVNMVALQGLGRRLNYPVDEQPGDDAIARMVLQAAVDGDEDWAIPTEAEVSLAMGNLEGASKAIARLVASDVGVFQVQSLRRQLSEIWRLDELDPLLLELDNRLAGPGEIVLPSTADLEAGPGGVIERFEKIFDTAQALSYWNLVDGLAVSESVGKVTDRSGRGIGTAFLVAGDVICESLGSGPILVTNAHVTSAEYNGAISAADAQVRFQVTRDESGEPLVCDGLTEIWSSPLFECDVTFLRFDQGRPALSRWLEPAEGLPAAIQGAYVSVVGHPAAGELSLSIRGNDLIETDGKRMHYLAPTQPGSSGSPVFDQHWRLIGVHHAGHETMPRLTGHGHHKANEATTLDYIRAEFATQRQQVNPTG